MPKILLTSVGVVLATALLLIGAVWLRVSLCPPGKTIRALHTISVETSGLRRKALKAYVPFVDYMVLSGTTLYAGNPTQGIVGVVETRDRGTVTTVALGAVHGVAIDTDDGLGFASDSSTNTVDVFDLTSNQPLGKISVDDDPDAIVYDRKLHLIYVACHDAGVGDVIDPVALKVTSRIPLGGKAEFAQADPATGVIYQNVMDTSEVVIVDPRSAAVTARYKVGTAEMLTGLAVDSAHRRLFVTGFGRKVFVLNSDTGAVITALPIGYGSDGVAYDENLGRIYVANGLSATLTVIQQDSLDHYRVLENAPTHFFGHSVVVDPFAHRVYVAYFGRIAVYAAP